MGLEPTTCVVVCYAHREQSGLTAPLSLRNSSFPHNAGALWGPLCQINNSTGLSPTTKSIREVPKGTSLIDGARDGTRTHDLLITNQLRYQLRHSSLLIFAYAGNALVGLQLDIIYDSSHFFKSFFCFSEIRCFLIKIDEAGRLLMAAVFVIVLLIKCEKTSQIITNPMFVDIMKKHTKRVLID